MNNPVFSVVTLLFFGQLFVAIASDPDMDAIMTANASTAPANIPKDRYVFGTLGSTFKVYMFAQHTANPINTLHIRVGSPAGFDNKFFSNANPGDSITINCTPNQTVYISMTNFFNDNFPAWDIAGDGFCHVKVLGFPGYDKGTIHIPPGLWLEWEDARDHSAPFDYNNFCVVLTGCTVKFFTRNPVNDAVWDTVVQNPHLINLGNRIISRTIESKF